MAACSPALCAIGIMSIVLLIITSIVLIVLAATGNLHFGAITIPPPTPAQIVGALTSGVTVTATDPASGLAYQSRIRVTPSTAGIGMSVVSSMQRNGLPIGDIGGDTLTYTLGPGLLGSSGPGVSYNITDTATAQQIIINSRMEVAGGTPAPPTFRR